MSIARWPSSVEEQNATSDSLYTLTVQPMSPFQFTPPSSCPPHFVQFEPQTADYDGFPSYSWSPRTASPGAGYDVGADYDVFSRADSPRTGAGYDGSPRTAGYANTESYDDGGPHMGQASASLLPSNYHDSSPKSLEDFEYILHGGLHWPAGQLRGY